MSCEHKKEFLSFETFNSHLIIGKKLIIKKHLKTSCRNCGFEELEVVQEYKKKEERK